MIISTVIFFLLVYAWEYFLHVLFIFIRYLGLELKVFSIINNVLYAEVHIPLLYVVWWWILYRLVFSYFLFITPLNSIEHSTDDYLVILFVLTALDYEISLYFELYSKPLVVKHSLMYGSIGNASEFWTI